MAIFIPLISVFDAKGIRQAQTGMAGLAQSVKSLKSAAAGAAASMAAIGTTSFIKDSVTAARDLERNLYGLESVFGSMTPAMEKYAKGASAIGLSQGQAAQASTFLGSVLKQSGFEMSTVSSETQKLVGLAADLSATYGYDLSEALTGMTALFRGEYDPIEKFGVAMKQAEVNALLAARGQNKLTGASLRQAQAQARLDILYQRSQDAQGNYAKQAGTLFVVQTQLKASFENLKATLGGALTGPLANFLNNFVPVLDRLQGALLPLFQNLGTALENLGPVLAAKADNFIVMAEAINPVITALTDLITPLLIPLAGIFEVLTNIIKPFIPLITFLAKVIQAVLIPVVSILNFIFLSATQTIKALFEGLSRLGGVIPALGDFFAKAGKDLDDFTSMFDIFTKKSGVTGNAYDDLVGKFSKELPLTDIDGIGTGTEKAAAGIQKATDKLNAFIQDAVGIQKSIMGSANITDLVSENSNEIFKSIVYLDGKFKTIAFSASKGASDIVGAFKDKLGKIKEFYKNLRTLTRAGLDPMLIEQIVSAGPEAGNATAKAILESGKAGIDGLNKTAKGIQKVAGDIGVLGATAMKKAGSRLGNGLIDGLYDRQDSLIAAAKDLGAGIGDAIAESAGERLKRIVAEAKAAGYNLSDADKKKIDPSYKPEKYVPKTPKKVLPKVAGLSMPQFISQYRAGVAGAGLEGAYRLMESEDIVNPFAMGTQGFSKFKETQAKANEYNISINVAPGASGAQIGDALVKAIQEYERAKGKGWRSN